MRSAAGLVLLLALACPNRAGAAVQDEVRAVFDRFVAAQNAHDVQAVAATLDESDGFLWVTKGTPIWGRQAALERFSTLYQGSWRLEPRTAELRVVPLGADAARLFVPVVFTIGEPGKPPQQVTFLMNQVLARTPSGWRITTILPIPAAPQP